MSPSRKIACCFAGFFLALGSLTAAGQAYPTRPVEIIVTTSPGSGGDLVSRAVSEIARRERFLPQALVVVNRIGGAGVLGYTYFKSRRGDPYSMMSVTQTILSMAYRPDINIALDNYRPVALMAIDPQTIMVPANSPYKSVKELVEAARNAPDTLVCATTAFQGTGRLVIFLLEKSVPGARFRFVNFKGGGEAVTSTAGGHTTFTTENLSEGLGFVESKTLRVLAVASSQRLPQAPDVPTLKELGYPITAGTIRGFTFMAGVPKEAVATMEGALAKVHASAVWKDIAARNLFEDIFMGSAEFEKYLRVRMEEYRQYYDAIGYAKSRP